MIEISIHPAHHMVWLKQHIDKTDQWKVCQGLRVIRWVETLGPVFIII